MKKNIIIAISAVMLLASCGTYAGAGAGTGAYWGHIIGGAVGGITGGHRGYHTGELIGLASGAIIGAAIGSAADQQREDDMQQYYAEKERLAQNRAVRSSQKGLQSYSQGSIDSGFDESNSGEDRIDIDMSDESGYPADDLSMAPVLEIRNAVFYDADDDNAIGRGEKCKVEFEVFNRGTATLYDLQPMVAETSGNKHVFVSQNTPVKSLAPGKGFRYTALVVGDTMLKNGTAKICLSVLQNGKVITKISEFNVVTKK